MLRIGHTIDLLGIILTSYIHGAEERSSDKQCLSYSQVYDEQNRRKRII